MSELTEDKILEKAKELCRIDRKAWSLDDFSARSAVTKLTDVADDKDRAEYLRRAKALLKVK